MTTRSADAEVVTLCVAHPRWFWGVRLHALCAPRRHAPGAHARHPRRDEREVALGLRERILSRFLCLAACISLNHRLGRPSRALVDYCA